MVDAGTFEQLAEVEIRQSGVREAQATCAVTDGAVWLQHFIDLHWPYAMRILDFPHAAEYVSALGELYGPVDGAYPANGSMGCCIGSNTRDRSVSSSI